MSFENFDVFWIVCEFFESFVSFLNRLWVFWIVCEFFESFIWIDFFDVFWNVWLFLICLTFIENFDSLILFFNWFLCLQFSFFFFTVSFWKVCTEGLCRHIWKFVVCKKKNNFFVLFIVLRLSFFSLGCHSHSSFYLVLLMFFSVCFYPYETLVKSYRSYWFLSVHIYSSICRTTLLYSFNSW